MTQSESSLPLAIEHLEERLTNCDRIYRMGIKLQTAKNAKAKETYQIMAKHGKNLSDRITELEQQLNELPNLIESIVVSEMANVHTSCSSDIVQEYEAIVQQNEQDTTLRDLNSDIANLKKICRIQQAKSYTRMMLLKDFADL